MTSIEARISSKARELEFAACGFARADAADEAGVELRQWLDAGRHGEMGWMETRYHHRKGVQALWPEAKSVIALGLSYAPAQDPRALEERGDIGRISVYAQGADYHKLVKQKLKALARWLVEEEPCEVKVFVDTAPVMEKPLAAAAGVGWQGKHTNLLNRNDGNWLFLGIIYTTLELEPSGAASMHCGSCTACIEACPTGAIDAPHRLDARKCISYLTIEHSGPIPDAYREAMGNRIYGCDDCLAACPWNRFADAAHAHRKFLPRAELVAPRLADLLQLDDAAFREMFSGSPIKRIGRNRMVRNCLIAAGNSGAAALRPHAERLANDPDPVVADAARWALERLA
ncbi:tRNA epoxyqueuosine(34) reductase QueG [Sphingomicrobium sediminis]|uniref:Epoxyqueuosine reductase n=1 Tax=Sphingomicrobium sediminis TaxID=2950949 RepID=A0A9X2EHW7_9SPHN|nr:tRNA epoxyqueuosine(34) reductase QueG [Sphingomicrobium sediminis]MCM8558348.1 tRNA epoxyqueuosine(34) reductase QueG [Sphingomicrobium sediminis]